MLLAGLSDVITLRITDVGIISRKSRDMAHFSVCAHFIQRPRL